MASSKFEEIQELVAKNNKSTDITDRLFMCLIWKESGFDPDVTNAHSSATGLMQMTKGAVEEVNRVTGSSFSHGEMSTPATNIEAGTRYVDLLKKRHKGSLSVALDKFGTGPGYSKSIIACSLCWKPTRLIVGMPSQDSQIVKAE